MDCIEAREKIDLYVDDMLDEADKQRLIWHASSCPQCKKALDDAVRLKQALADLGEVTPPAGLAAAAVKKAKQRRVPVFAYATAAVAAVIALVFAFSPQLLRGNLTGENADEKIMYSAEEEAAPEDGFAMDSATGGEVAEAPQIERSFGAGAPLTSGEVGSAAIATNAAPYTFENEKELIAALRDGAEGVRGMAYYYRPKKLPQGAVLQYITVSDFSVRWVYSLNTSQAQPLVFEWYRTITTDDLQDWSAKTQLYSNNLARSFQHSGDVFWSAEGRVTESGELEATDSSAINAYWLQDGAAFHMELPATFTQENVLAYCTAERTPLQ